MTHKLTTEEMHRLSVEEFRQSEKLPLTVVLRWCSTMCGR